MPFNTFFSKLSSFKVSIVEFKKKEIYFFFAILPFENDELLLILFISNINKIKEKKINEKKNENDNKNKDDNGNEENDENNDDEIKSGQIILSSKNLEKAKETIRNFDQNNCCANLNKIKLENKVTKEKISGNSGSTNLNSEEEKKEIE